MIQLELFPSEEKMLPCICIGGYKNAVSHELIMVKSDEDGLSKCCKEFGLSTPIWKVWRCKTCGSICREA